jgi:hypothetical protein
VEVPFEYSPGCPGSLWELERALTDLARDPLAGILVLERLIERGFRSEPLVWDFRPPPPRTQSDHYVVIEALDPDQRPVAGVRVELLIADGEVKQAQTDGQGIVRVERIQAGRVVIRVLGLDGELWRPLGVAAVRNAGAELARSPTGTEEGHPAARSRSHGAPRAAVRSHVDRRDGSTPRVREAQTASKTKEREPA